MELVLAATPLQVRVASPAARLVVLSASAEYEAELQGRDRQNFEDAVTEAALAEAGRENFVRINQFCENLDRALVAAKLPAPNGQSHCEPHALALKALCDRLYFRALPILRLVRECPPSRIIHPATDLAPSDDYLSFRGSMAGAVCEHLSALFDIASASFAPPTIIAPRSRPTVRGCVRQAVQAIRQLISRTHAVALASRGQQHVYLLDNGYQGYFRDAGVPTRLARSLVGSRPPHYDRRPWREVYHTVAGQNWYRTPWIVDGVDFTPVIEPILDHFITNVLPKHAAYAWRAAARLTAANGLKAVAGPCVGDVPNLAIRSAAQAQGIPVFTWQHGGINAYIRFPMLRYSDLAAADDYLCWGEGSVQYVRTAFAGWTVSGKPPAEPRAVSSPALMAVRTRCAMPPATDRPRVLWVSSAFSGESRYFSGSLYPDIGYFALQRRLVNVLAECEGIQPRIRLYPWNHEPSPLREIIGRKGLGSALDINPSLGESLAQADVVVIDYPSTTLLQSVASFAQIAVLCDRTYLEITDEAARLLERRAFVAYTPDAFEQSIRQAIAAARGGDRRLDEGFLAAYGIGDNPDALSIPRAIAERWREQPTSRMKNQRF